MASSDHMVTDDQLLKFKHVPKWLIWLVFNAETLGGAWMIIDQRNLRMSINVRWDVALRKLDIFVMTLRPSNMSIIRLNGSA